MEPAVFGGLEPPEAMNAPAFRPGLLITRAEHDRVDDGDHAALRRREREVAEPAHHALHHALIGQVTPTVGCHLDRSAAIDDELHLHAALEIGIVLDPVLVAEAE